MADQELKWWHVRWGLAFRGISRFAILAGKILGVLCLIAAVGFSVLYLLAPWQIAHRLGKFEPGLYIVPASLSTNAEAPLSSASTDFCGFRFLLPSRATVRTLAHQRMAIVQTHNGGLMVESSLCDPFLGSEFTSVTVDQHEQKLLGQELFHSNFALMQAAMSVTPNQVKWWRFRSSENKRTLLLLFRKFSDLIQSTSHDSFAAHPIYTFSFGQFRGFQVGSLDVPPYEAHIHLFDKSDRYLSLNISGSEGHGPVLTQEEINAFVASIQPPTDR